MFVSTHSEYEIVPFVTHSKVYTLTYANSCSTTNFLEVSNSIYREYINYRLHNANSITNKNNSSPLLLSVSKSHLKYYLKHLCLFLIWKKNFAIKNQFKEKNKVHSARESSSRPSHDARDCERSDPSC